MHLEQFNAAPRPDAVAVLRPCLGIQRWIDEIVDARPYDGLEALRNAGRRAAEPFTPAEVAAALADHPRIGEQAPGTGTGARLARAEQEGLGEAGAAAAQALADGNRAYEAKFGQVFLIRAAGRSRGEILASLATRLAHTPGQEQVIIGQQLREIAVLRLEGVLEQ